MKPYVFVGCIAGYLALSATVFAGITADRQWKCHHSWTRICDQDMVGQDRGLAVMFASNPAGWGMAFLFTGFFQHGFSFSATPSIVTP